MSGEVNFGINVDTKSVDAAKESLGGFHNVVQGVSATLRGDFVGGARQAVEGFKKLRELTPETRGELGKLGQTIAGVFNRKYSTADIKAALSGLVTAFRGASTSIIGALKSVMAWMMANPILAAVTVIALAVTKLATMAEARADAMLEKTRAAVDAMKAASAEFQEKMVKRQEDAFDPLKRAQGGDEETMRRERDRAASLAKGKRDEARALQRIANDRPLTTDEETQVGKARADALKYEEERLAIEELIAKAAESRAATEKEAADKLAAEAKEAADALKKAQDALAEGQEKQRVDAMTPQQRGEHFTQKAADAKAEAARAQMSVTAGRGEAFATKRDEALLRAIEYQGKAAEAFKERDKDKAEKAKTAADAKKERDDKEREARASLRTTLRDRAYEKADTTGKAGILAREIAAAQAASFKAFQGGDRAEAMRQAETFAQKRAQLQDLLNPDAKGEEQKPRQKRSAGSYIADLSNAIALRGVQSLGVPGVKPGAAVRTKDQELLDKIERHLREQGQLWKAQLGGG